MLASETVPGEVGDLIMLKALCLKIIPDFFQYLILPVRIREVRVPAPQRRALLKGQSIDTQMVRRITGSDGLNIG